MRKGSNVPKLMSEDMAKRCTGGLASPRYPGRGAEDERDIDGPTTGFGELLSCLRLAAGMSQHALGLAAGVDASYINRLERGERSEPSREVVIALARVLDVTPVERERLLWTAGYLPLCLQGSGRAGTAVWSLLQVLASDAISELGRQRLSKCVEAIAALWMEGGERQELTSNGTDLR